MKNTFWSSGAARSIKQKGGRLTSGHWPNGPCVSDVAFDVAARARVYFQNHRAIRRLIAQQQLVFELALDNQQTSAGVREDEFDIVSREKSIDGHTDSSNCDSRQKRGDEFR